MQEDFKIERFKMKYLNKVKKIYRDSFPEQERASFNLLIFNLIRKCELYVLLDNNEISGFIYLINYKTMVFILYLAIDSLKRGKGYGAYILNWCKEYKKDKTIYLNIDEIDNKFEDNNIREKRLKFYQKNGFILTNYMSVEKKCNFNIMSTEDTFNIEEYKELDKRVAKLLLDSKSSIEKRI